MTKLYFLIFSLLFFGNLSFSQSHTSAISTLEKIRYENFNEVKFYGLNNQFDEIYIENKLFTNTPNDSLKKKIANCEIWNIEIIYSFNKDKDISRKVFRINSSSILPNNNSQSSINIPNCFDLCIFKHKQNGQFVDTISCVRQLERTLVIDNVSEIIKLDEMLTIYFPYYNQIYLGFAVRHRFELRQQKQISTNLNCIQTVD